MIKTTAMVGRPAGKRNSTVSAEEIIWAWQTSENVREAHEKLGRRMSLTALNSRVHLLRMKGIPLKSMTGTRRRTYTRSRIEELKALAESLNGTPIEESMLGSLEGCVSPSQSQPGRLG